MQSDSSACQGRSSLQPGKQVQKEGHVGHGLVLKFARVDRAGGGIAREELDDVQAGARAWHFRCRVDPFANLTFLKIRGKTGLLQRDNPAGGAQVFQQMTGRLRRDQIVQRH
jgi:hypothetical protein